MSPSVVRLLRFRSLGLLAIFSALVAGATIVAPRLLILDNAVPSDYVLVLDGHDDNYYAGLQLLRQGFGNRMFVCLDIPDVPLQGEELSRDREFIQQTAGQLADRIDLCSNADEDIPQDLEHRLIHADAKSVLIVTPEARSRAQYIVARRRLPQYNWSVHAVPDPSFNIRWWRRRLWTKTFVSSIADLGAAYQTRVPQDQRLESSAR